MKIKKETYRNKIMNQGSSHITKWRKSLRGVLKNSIHGKEGKYNKLLKYSPIDLRIHIKKQFVKDMSWENYGYYGENIWNIDHIISLSNFKPDTPSHIVNEMENIRPSLSIPNGLKGNKILINNQEDRKLYFKYKKYLKDEIIEKYDKKINKLLNYENKRKSNLPGMRRTNA